MLLDLDVPEFLGFWGSDIFTNPHLLRNARKASTMYIWWGVLNNVLQSECPGLCRVVDLSDASTKHKWRVSGQKALVALQIFPLRKYIIHTRHNFGRSRLRGPT